MLLPMKIYKVYLLTNTNTGKQYVGQTERDIYDRWKTHVSAAMCGSPLQLHQSIRKHGVECWTHVQLWSCDSYEECLVQEKMSIVKFDTYRNGYNANGGGTGGNMRVRMSVAARQEDSIKRSIRYSREGNPNHSGISDQGLFDIVSNISVELGYVPGRLTISSRCDKFPKNFSKNRFNGRYSNLAKQVALKLNLTYNPSYRNPEQCAAASKLGKLFIWVTNGTLTKRILITDLQEYENNNYIRGRK